MTDNYGIAEPSFSSTIWINKHAAAKLLGISVHTLKTYRKEHWQRGIHFQHLNSRTIRYHKNLLLDWLANRFYPEAHQRAIELYLASLLSNQPKKCSRRNK